MIFVGGTARSGSTWLDLVLGNDPHGFSLGEVASWYRPTRTHHFDIKCGCGVYPCPVWEDLRRVDEARLYHAIFERQGARFVVDSSKRLPWIIDQNRRLHAAGDVRVVNLFVYKEPLALFVSHARRGEDGVAAVRRAFVYYEEALRARLPLLTVNHEWLVGGGIDALRVVCERLQIGCPPDKLEFWRHTHHHLFGSFGLREQIRDRAAAPARSEGPRAEIPDAARHALENDARLQRVLEHLRSADLRVAELPSPASLARIRRPRFYWEQRVRDWRARHWPAHHLDREASTIREWKV